MAITAAPFALKNLGLDAEPLRQAMASLIPNTGGLIQSGDLAVTQTAVASLGVTFGVGRAWLPGNNTANLAGQSYSTQGQYFLVNDSTTVTVNLATANATNPRIDLIYVGAVDTFYGGGSDVIKFDKITGTPAASPAAPTLPAGSNALALATVYVAANATTVTNANITNLTSPVLGTPIPVFGNNNVAVGSGTSLLANLTGHSITPIIQAGSVVVTGDVNGYANFAYPKPFPNGIISVVVSNGDNTATGKQYQVNLGSAAQTATTCYVNCNANGTAFANPFRCNYIAIGW